MSAASHIELWMDSPTDTNEVTKSLHVWLAFLKEAQSGPTISFEILKSIIRLISATGVLGARVITNIVYFIDNILSTNKGVIVNLTGKIKTAMRYLILHI